MTRGDLLRRRADLFWALAEVDRELATLEEEKPGRDEPTYTSVSLPPGVGRDRFRRVCADIAKAGGESHRDGKTWIVTRAAWARHRASQTLSSNLPAKPSKATPKVETIDVDDVLATHGYRPIGPKNGQKPSRIPAKDAETHRDSHPMAPITT